MNLESGKIKIFPTPNRGTDYQPQARLVTEFNLTNIVNRLVDKESFVISYKNNKITFNIYGYWVEADFTDNPSLLTGNLYARIQVLDTNNFAELNGGDTEAAKYEGVTFLTDNRELSTAADGYHSLKLLENGKVPEDSWVKFTTSATTRSVTIDDGDLDPVQ